MFDTEDPETFDTIIQSLVVMTSWICTPLSWLQKFGCSFTGQVSLQSGVHVFKKKRFRKELEKCACSVGFRLCMCVPVFVEVT
jgi:hypothetical protein